MQLDPKTCNNPAEDYRARDPIIGIDSGIRSQKAIAARYESARTRGTVDAK